MAIDKYQDIIDSRDIIERIEELKAERQALQDSLDESIACCEHHGTPENHPEHFEAQELREARAALAAWDESDESAELKAIQALADEASGYAPDWKYGEALIRESYFERYAQELADDIGAIPKGVGWPCTCIDWEQAARELAQDYTEVDFDGVTYLIRS